MDQIFFRSLFQSAWIKRITCFILLLTLSGCLHANSPQIPVQIPPVNITETVDAAPASIQVDPSPTFTPVPTLAPSQTPTALPTATVARRTLTATVWTQDPWVPVLVYHRFQPLKATQESSTRMRLQNFRQQLEMLDQAGFTLVSLADWLKGDLRVLPGKRPLVFTMDDLFFADQIFLNPDGSPSLRSGLGVLWQFSEEHPDFGFSVALFYSLGDKLYANRQVGDWFEAGEGWEDSLAEAIAWCMEHGAIPYNHFYTHPRLIQMEPADITRQLRQNEVRLQELLDRIGKADLAAHSDNLIALTYSVWPESKGGQKAIMTYRSIYDLPAMGVLEASPYFSPKYLMKPPYDAGFSPWHIPRFNGNNANVEKIIQQLDQFPVAQECILQVDLAQGGSDNLLVGAIQEAVKDGLCPAGVYAVENLLFRADGKTVTLLELQHPDAR